MNPQITTSNLNFKLISKIQPLLLSLSRDVLCDPDTYISLKNLLCSDWCLGIESMWYMWSLILWIYCSLILYIFSLFRPALSSETEIALILLDLFFVCDTHLRFASFTDFWCRFRFRVRSFCFLCQCRWHQIATLYHHFYDRCICSLLKDIRKFFIISYPTKLVAKMIKLTEAWFAIVLQ